MTTRAWQRTLSAEATPRQTAAGSPPTVTELTISPVSSSPAVQAKKRVAAASRQVGRIMVSSSGGAGCGSRSGVAAPTVRHQPREGKGIERRDHRLVGCRAWRPADVEELL